MIAGITGVLLAGGQSRRFGANKALALLAGRRLIEHPANVMAGLFAHRLLVTNTPEQYDFLGWPMIADLFPDAGPLAGIHAALSAAKDDRIFVAACDMPGLDPATIRLLCAIPGPWDVVVPWRADGAEPLCAVYAKSALPVMEEALQAENFQVQAVLTKLRTRMVKASELPPEAGGPARFVNVNTRADLAAASMQPLDLSAAQRLITTTTQPLARETIPLDAALGRVAVVALRARRPVPHFRQARRDGFAVSSFDLTGSASLAVVGEIPAGRTDLPSLARGQAVRIMTGAALPQGADTIIPLEDCRETSGRLEILAGWEKNAWIRRRGADWGEGKTIVRQGEEVIPEHLPLLAATGCAEITVRRQPRVAILATGSELLEPGQIPLPGQMTGGNLLLLNGLLLQEGARPTSLGTVPDQREAILATLRPLADEPVDLVITTGGTGPGSHDLIPWAFAELGIRLLFRGLRIRPGGHALMGILDSTLYLGLPGPPPAVRILFNELVRPALAAMLGRRPPSIPRGRAALSQEIIVRQEGVLHLKGGVISTRNGTVSVRPALPHEPLDAIVLVPPHRRRLRVGETVTIHPV